MKDFPKVDYLAVGHVSRDLTPYGVVPGGSVTYASRIAKALGCRTAILTSASSNFDFEGSLPGIYVKSIPAAETTTFENIYTSGGRQQKIRAVAEPIHKADVPREWRRASIVHLGPIAAEIDSDLIDLFSNSLIGLTPQGWYRKWDETGRVTAKEWPIAEYIFSLAGAVILSKEDLANPKMLAQIRNWTSLLVLTEQSGGCTVYCYDEARQFPAPTVKEVNPTGAGDIFAAAYLVRLKQTNGNPWEAAEFANQIAAESVTHETMDSKVKAIETYLRPSV